MKHPIITSLLDLDLYKLTMLQVAWKNFPDAVVEYTYKCRNNIEFPPAVVREIKEQIAHLSSLRFSDDDLEKLGKLRYMHPGFIWFLRNYQLDHKAVKIQEAPFSLTIEGPWVYTILFEIYLLAIISEVHYMMNCRPEATAETGWLTKGQWAEGDKRLLEKIKLIKELDNPDFRLIEFGTRRRYSKVWQKHVLETLVQEIPQNLFGTSNVKLGLDHNLRLVGTMAHEYLQAFQALGPRLVDSQKAALETWVQFYRGDLGIALTDVISMDAFLRDFDLFYAKLFDGLRHDSGCPFEWSQKAIQHYKSLNIDPKTKALVYSDGLDVPKAISLFLHFEAQIKTSFGIGTNLTNDLPNITPVNHVLKMTMCNGQPVAKVAADSPGKGMCKDEDFLNYLKYVYQIKA